MDAVDIKKLKWQKKTIVLQQKQASETEKTEEFNGIYYYSILPIADKIYLLGQRDKGRLESYCYDIESNKLTTPKFIKSLQKIEIPTKLVHKAIVLDTRIYVLYNLSPSNPNCAIIIDTDVDSSFQILGDTSSSSFRVNYSINDFQNLLILFGGLNEKAEPLNSVEAFDITTYRWTHIQTYGKSPSPRHNHSSCKVKDSLYIYGGSSSELMIDPTFLEDFYKLDLNTFHWTPIKTTGSIPTNLMQSSMFCIENDKILCVWNHKGYKSLTILNIDMYEWSEVPAEGDKPLKRYCSACNLAGSKIVIIGGFSEKNITDIIVDYLELP